MRTKTKAERADEAWLKVAKALEGACLVAWDGCHKIYVAMDETQGARLMNDYECLRSGPFEMLYKVQFWFGNSCGMRFVSSVSTNLENPNADYIPLIRQGQI